MTRPAKLSDTEVQQRLAELPGWTLDEGALHRELVFSDFSEAWGFMSRVALEAEHLGHHPDWCNSYNRVIVQLSTHDAGGITELDFALASHIENTRRQTT
jgi:4a-hydroxytetrahydrobiopterin dehydratase